MPPSMPVSHTGNKDAVYPSLTANVERRLLPIYQGDRMKFVVLAAAAILSISPAIGSLAASERPFQLSTFHEVTDSKLQLIRGDYGNATCLPNGACGVNATTGTGICGYVTTSDPLPLGTACTGEGGTCQTTDTPGAGTNYDCLGNSGAGCTPGTAANYCATRVVSSCTTTVVTGLIPTDSCGCDAAPSHGVGTHDTCK
jgi:hypothetical protein